MDLKVKKYGLQFCYEWLDEHGFHQYYCEIMYNLEHPGVIKRFDKKEKDNGLFYQWNDDLGYHTHFEEF